MKKTLFTMALLVWPQFSLAHAGDHAESSVNHLFTDLFHMVPVLGIIAISTYYLSKGKSTKNSD